MLYDLSGGFAHATLSLGSPFMLGYLHGALFALLPMLYLISGAKIKLHLRESDRVSDASGDTSSGGGTSGA